MLGSQCKIIYEAKKDQTSLEGVKLAYIKIKLNAAVSTGVALPQLCGELPQHGSSRYNYGTFTYQGNSKS